MKDNIETIANAGNTEVPVYLAIKKLGYKLSCEKRNNNEEWWFAENDKQKFVASNLLELLGLIAMRDIRGMKWKAQDNEIDGFLSTYYPESLE